MDPYEDDLSHEEKIDSKNRNVFELIPGNRQRQKEGNNQLTLTRSRPKKPQPPTSYGVVNGTYEMINRTNGELIKEGTLIFLDRNNQSRVINQFGSFYTKSEWLKFSSPSKLHSIVAETVYNGIMQNGYLRWIEHTSNMNMMAIGKVDERKMVENFNLNIETEYGWTCLEIMPINLQGGDHLIANDIMNDESSGNDIHNINRNKALQNNIVNVLAGCDDGSIIMTDFQIPEQDEVLFEEFKDPNNYNMRDYDNNDYDDDLINNKSGMRIKGQKTKKRGKYLSNQYEAHHRRKPTEMVWLHKDTVTSIRQRPSYPYQFLTTSLDGEAVLCLLGATLNHPDLVVVRYTEKICQEGIGDSAWMDENWFIAKNEEYGQLLLQDVREGEGWMPTHLFTTPNLCKINNMDLNFPFIGIAWDDGNLSILDLRKVESGHNHNLMPLFNVWKAGEAWMWVKLLKDTVRIYGWYERSGIFGYRFIDDDLGFDNMEWHGVYDSDKYGLPKSLHVIHQEKKEEEDGSIYWQDVLWISSFNGSYVYALVQDDEEVKLDAL
jgi:hypothetical protein